MESASPRMNFNAETATRIGAHPCDDLLELSPDCSHSVSHGPPSADHLLCGSFCPFRSNQGDLLDL